MLNALVSISQKSLFFYTDGTVKKLFIVGIIRNTQIRFVLKGRIFLILMQVLWIVTNIFKGLCLLSRKY